MSEENQSFLKEIQEDIRRERLIKRAYRYAPYGIAVIVMILVGTLGWVGWQEWQRGRNEAQTAHLVSALSLMQTQNPQTAAQSLSEGLGGLDDPKAVLSRLLEASVRARGDDLTGAIEALGPLLEDQTNPEAYRTLARFLSVLYAIDIQDPAGLEQKLTPLLEEDHPWHHHALELQAILAQRQNDTERALDLLSQLQEEETTPETLKARAYILSEFFKNSPDASEGEKPVMSSQEP